MLNFTYCNPVNVQFGKGSTASIDSLLPQNCTVMITYGSGSIFKNGAYDQVKAALGSRKVVEFGGIEPNPHYETCMKAVEMVKSEKVDFILAVGGGSVLDGTKFIAAAAKFEGEDPWAIVESSSAGGEDLVKDAVPLGSVITLPATGSEMNCTAVISRVGRQLKLHFASEKVFPKFSIIDPEFTQTLSERQTGNGVVDAFVHIAEQIITYDVNAPVTERMAIGVMRTLVENGPKALVTPNDYDVRANISWSATVGLNGWLGCGVVQDWSTHMLGHELTAVYGLDHGRTLAIVMIAIWRKLKEQKREKLLMLAHELWKLEGDSDAVIDEAINLTENFFNTMKVPTKLADHGIDNVEAAKTIKERLQSRNKVFGEQGNIDGNLASEIILTC